MHPLLRDGRHSLLRAIAATATVRGRPDKDLAYSGFRRAGHRARLQQVFLFSSVYRCNNPGRTNAISGKMVRMIMQITEAITKKLTLLKIAPRPISGARALTT